MRMSKKVAKGRNHWQSTNILTVSRTPQNGKETNKKNIIIDMYLCSFSDETNDEEDAKRS